MTEEERMRLLDGFLAGELDANESKRFSTEIERNPELAETVRFEMGMRRAVDKSIGQGFRERHERRAATGKWKTWIIATAIVVLLAVFAYWLSLTRSDNNRLLSPEREREVLAVAVTEAERDKLIGRSLGDSDWQDDLLAGSQNPLRYDSAYATLLTLVDARSPCDSPRETYFLALLQTYRTHEFSEADEHLACFTEPSSPYYRAAVGPRWVVLTALGKSEAARTLEKDVDPALRAPRERK